MLYAQIDPRDGRASLLDVDAAYPGGGWTIIRPLMEAQGWAVVAIENDTLPGTHYDLLTEKFYTPTEPTPELPTEAELLRQEVAELKAKLDTMETMQMATASAVADIGAAVMNPQTP